MSNRRRGNLFGPSPGWGFRGSNSIPPQQDFAVQPPTSPASTEEESEDSNASRSFSSNLSEEGSDRAGATRAILFEFVHTGNGLTPANGGRIGCPILYHENQSVHRDNFIYHARRTALDAFNIPGMTDDVDITMYAIWNQGADQVSTLVTDNNQFQRCIALMEKRKNVDRFQLIYVGHIVNGD
jgi:hypothetical protein